MEWDEEEHGGFSPTKREVEAEAREECERLRKVLMTLSR